MLLHLSFSPGAAKSTKPLSVRESAGLTAVLVQLSDEFPEIPPGRLRSVFVSCLMHLDTPMRDARPELVYRLATQRLILASVGSARQESPPSDRSGPVPFPRRTRRLAAGAFAMS